MYPRMSVFGVLLGSLLVVAGALAQEPTHCASFRMLTTDAIPAVFCNTEIREITLGQYNGLARKNAGNPAQFCVDGTVNAAAMIYLVYNTPSGYPEPCDVFQTAEDRPWSEAPNFYVVYNDLYEHEMEASTTTILWQNNVIIGFDPMPPDLTVDPPVVSEALPLVLLTKKVRPKP